MQYSIRSSIVAILLLPLFFTGCVGPDLFIIAYTASRAASTSVEVAKNARGAGVKRTYQKPVSEVWSAMRHAVVKTGGVIQREDKENCSILAEYGIGLLSWGERVAIFCEPIKKVTSTSWDLDQLMLRYDYELQTETEVVSRRADLPNETATYRTDEIYSHMDAQLK
jgi:hypothetical protein